MRCALFYSFVGSLLCGLALGQEFKPIGEESIHQQRTESASKQFTVYGGDFRKRSAFTSTLDQIREGFLDSLSERKSVPFKWPIILQLHGREGDEAPERSVALEPLIVENGWRFQLHVHLGKGLDAEAFQREVLRALILERGLRDVSPDAVMDKLSVPLWLISGMEEAIAWKRGVGDRKLYESILKTGSLMKLDEMLALENETSLDPASKTAFQVSSGALTISLLGKGKKGVEAFDGFLAELPLFDGEMSVLLRKYFPGLNLSQNSLTKWLQLQLANLASPLVVETMTVDETEARLSEVLIAYLRDETGGIREIPLSLWRNILTEKRGVAAIHQISRNLTQMSYRCFPLYRPLIEDYQTVLKNLLDGETGDVEETLLKLKKDRGFLQEQAERVRDYLDWYEVNNGLRRGESFEDFVQLKRELRSEKAPKSDHLSQYLNDMQRFFGESESSK